MGKPRRRHGPRRGHAGGPGNSMFGVETNTSRPPEVYTETASVGIIRASPPRLRQTGRYSGPPRGGAHVARPTARTGLAMVIPTGRPETMETVLGEEDASNSNPAVVAIANYTPYRETAMMATDFCSFPYMSMWDPSDLMRSGVQAFTTGPWFETRKFVFKLHIYRDMFYLLAIFKRTSPNHYHPSCTLHRTGKGLCIECEAPR